MSTRPFPVAVVADLALVTAIALLALFVAQSAVALQHPQTLGPAILCDLTLTTVVAHYFLGVRWAKMPAWTVAPVAGAGFLLASFALPAPLQPSGDVALIAIGALELLALGLAVVRIKTLASGFIAAKREGAPFFAALEAGFLAVVPQVPALSRWIRMEAELFFFAVTGWFQRTPTANNDDTRLFSHHKKTKWMTLAFVFALLSLIEGGLVHLILNANGWTVAAFIASGLHVYGLLWIFGDAHAVRLRPSSVDEVKLTVSLGWRAFSVIPLSTIDGVAVGDWTKKDVVVDDDGNGNGNDKAGFATVFGSANVELTLNAPARLRSVFGTKDIMRLYIQVDDAAAFAAALAPKNVG